MAGTFPSPQAAVAVNVPSSAFCVGAQFGQATERTVPKAILVFQKIFIQTQPQD
jgi:hypothetical protein